MARLTDSGDVKRSLPGLPGFHQAWQDFNAWLGGELRDQRIRMILVRSGNPGGGGGHHSAEWQDGYDLARHNGAILVKRALGVQTDNVLRDRPAKGTDKRNGYDAGAAAAQLAVGRISPS